jgi:hypothetical protein
MGVVYTALLICSDEDCTELFEAYGTLEELETLACDCGCSLEILRLCESEEQRPAAGFELARVA